MAYNVTIAGNDDARMGTISHAHGCNLKMGRRAGASHGLPSMLLAATWLLLSWAAPLQAQSAPEGGQLTQEIAELVNRQTSLIMRRDAAGLAAMFTPDATYVAANGAVLVGRARIREYYTQIFAIVGQSRAIIGDVVRQTRVDQVVALGDGAWAIGRGINFAGGYDIPLAMTDHWMAIYSRADGDWKIRALTVGEDAPRPPPD
jgi:uncharacterized protein (TIGR02246 family)